MYFPLMCLLLSCIISVLQVSGCPGLPLKLGNITRDTDVEVGSPLKIHCTLYVSTINSSGVSYSVNSSYLVIQKVKKQLKNIEVLNERSVQWKLESSNISDSGPYSCVLRLPAANLTSLICSTRITVGFKPLPVSHFSCISFNYENLTCNWKKPFNPVKTDYTLRRNEGYLLNFTYTEVKLHGITKWDVSAFHDPSLCAPFPVSNFGSLTAPFIKLSTTTNDSEYQSSYLIFYTLGCPKEYSYETSCSWTRNSSPIYKLASKKLSFTLVGKNSLDENVQTFIYNHLDIIKPGPPRFNVMIGKTSANISFFHSLGDYDGIDSGWQYKLCYSSGTDTTCEIFDDESGKKNHLVEKLVPFTSYTFRLSCRLRAGGKDMWSDNKTVTGITHPDVPYLSPIFPPSAFQSDVLTDYRNITVFWKPIPKEYWNGLSLCYLLSYHPCGSNSMKIEIRECTSTFLQVNKVPLDQCYLFRICAYNEIGVSVNCSHMTVDYINDAMPPVNTIIVRQLDDKAYNISWDQPSYEKEVLPVKSYTLFWCITPISFECKGPLNWTNVSGTTTILRDLAQNFRYNFAVSANYPNYTTGMKPATCIFYKKKALAGYGEAASIFLKALSSTSLRAEWRLDECFQRNIKEINVFYCLVNATHPSCTGEKGQKNMSSPLTTGDAIILEGLNVKSNYSVSFDAWTYDGFHVQSAPAYESTFSDDVEPSVLIGTSVGIAITCFTVIAITIFGIRRLKKRIDLEKNVEVVLPKGLNKELTNFYNQSDGKENNSGEEISRNSNHVNPSLGELITPDCTTFQNEFLYECENKQNPLLQHVKENGLIDDNKHEVISSNQFTETPAMIVNPVVQCPQYVVIGNADFEQQAQIETGNEWETETERFSAPVNGFGILEEPSTSIPSYAFNSQLNFQENGLCKDMNIPSLCNGGKCLINQSSFDGESNSKGNFLQAEDAELCDNSEKFANGCVEYGQNFSPYVPIKSMIFLYDTGSEKDKSKSCNNNHGEIQSIGRDEVRRSVEESLSNIKQFSNMPNAQSKFQSSGYVSSAFCSKPISAIGN